MGALAAGSVLALLPLMSWAIIGPEPLPVVAYELPPAANANAEGRLAHGAFEVGDDAFAWHLSGRFSERYEYALRVYRTEGLAVGLRLLDATLDLGGHGEAVTHGRDCACSVVRGPLPHLFVPLEFQSRDRLGPEDRPVEGVVSFRFETFRLLPMGAWHAGDVADAGLVRIP